MNQGNRTARIGHLMQVALAKILLSDMHDSRYVKITVTDVDVSPDLSCAKVYLSILDEDPEAVADILAMISAEGKFLRYRLAHEIKLRKMPVLHFRLDESIISSRRIDHLLREE